MCSVISEHGYIIRLQTGTDYWARTADQVTVDITGSMATVSAINLDHTCTDGFQRGRYLQSVTHVVANT